MTVVALVALGCTAERVGLPEDMLRLGDIRLATAAEATVAIDRSAAIDAAADAGYGRPDPSAYLVVPVGPGVSIGFENPVLRDMTWIVRWDGINELGPLPANADGSSPSRAPFQFLYVTIGAFTGKFVDATYME